jgi:Uma2 family endonuclease
MPITATISKLETSPANNAVLPNISWQTYQAMLTDMGNQRSIHLAYYHGILEIKMPLGLHETINYILERIIIALTEELDLGIRGFGSTTLSREDLAVGVEPDCCFYIQNSDRISGREIDLANDPPPDLVVEVDITSPSNRRFAIYRELGVPEIWKYSASNIRIYQLQANEYLESEFSLAFPIVSREILNQFLQQSTSNDDNKLIREFRVWIRQQIIEGGRRKSED